MEKEALAKGVPIGQALDIEIPPPRPKRKPSNPYPRKTGAATTAQVGAKDGKSETPLSSLRCKQVLDLEKEPLPEVYFSSYVHVSNSSCSLIMFHFLFIYASYVSCLSET